MKKRILWKVVFTLFVVVLATYLAFPPKEKIKLGLDLKGGMHLVFEVQTNDAIQKQTDIQIQRLKSLLKESSIEFENVVRKGTNIIEISGINNEQRKILRDEIFKESFPDWNALFLGNDTATLTLKEIKGEYLIRTIQPEFRETHGHDLDGNKTITKKIIESFRSTSDRTAAQSMLKDLNSLGEAELFSILNNSFPANAAEIAQKIISVRVSQTIIKDFSQLEHEGISQEVLSLLKRLSIQGNKRGLNPKI
jgi:preprotein translocase subunit SecD